MKARIREDLLKDDIGVPYINGNGFLNPKTWLSAHWPKTGEGLMIFYKNKWRRVYSMDFDYKYQKRKDER